MSHRLLPGLVLLCLSLIPFPNRSFAAASPDPDQGFRQPSPDLAAIVELPRSPLRDLSPDGRLILELTRAGAEPLADLARPERPLAGMRLDPDRPGPSRFGAFPGWRLLDGETGAERTLPALPAGARIGHWDWSPDSRHLALALVFAEAWRLALVDLESASLVLPDLPALSPVFGDPLTWLPDSRGLVVRVHESLAAPLPAGTDTWQPRVLETDGRKAPGRTWPDLLRTDQDEREFLHLAGSRLWSVLPGGTGWLARPLEAPAGLYTGHAPSPDGRWLLVEELRQPLSRTRPWEDFPTRIAVLQRDGSPGIVLTERPLADQVPISYGSCVTGPRDAHWRPDREACLVWSAALDGGDGGRPADPRDELRAWEAPFKGESVVLHRTADRLAGVQWGGPDLALVYSRWWADRRLVCERIRPDSPGKPADLLYSRNWQDRYTDPGRPLMVADGRGGQMLLRSADGDTLYYRGAGAGPEGEHPFLDAVSLGGGSRRLYQSPAGRYDTVVEFRPGANRLLLSRETRDQPPDWFLHEPGSGRETRLTRSPHPHPWLGAARKQVIHYRREDGLPLHGTLWLPPGWTPEAGPLPTLLWAYPDEFRSASGAGQVAGSEDRFERLSWANPVIWLLKGYAVLDDPSMPIVGEGDEQPNDRFVQQLGADARAAVDTLVALGICDPKRVAVGGHSYGAFMTANLLAHTDLFAAGLAFSGAYNRTLTPFGFQSEDRSFWQAPEVYMTMSPLAHAEGITEPLLLVHGEKDANPGTYPLQSERLYEALKGLGGTARLCMLPWEGHGYRARENQLHLLWEVETWLDRYLGSGYPASWPEE